MKAFIMSYKYSRAMGALYPRYISIKGFPVFLIKMYGRVGTEILRRLSINLEC